MSAIRWTFISDTHAQDHLPQAIALAAARIKDTKPDLLVFGGDMVEYDSVSSYCRTRLMESHRPHTVREEADSCAKDVLEPLVHAAPSKCQKIFLEGNHEYRIVRYVAARAEALEGLFDPTDILGCKPLGINYIPSRGGNAIYTRGPVHFMHGEFLGINPAKMHLERFGGPCVVFGHTHKMSDYNPKKGNGKQETSIGAGCMCGAPRFRDFDQYTRGFVEGWLDEKTGEYGAGHCKISGASGRFDYLYLPDAEYSAKCRYDKQGGEHWVAERVAGSKRKGIQG